MCGRYNFTASPDEIAASYGVTDPPTLSPRYNVAPSQVVAVIGLKPDGSTRAVALLRWGLVPYWSESGNPRVKPINVRAESVVFKFGEQLREKRCLIPASGFYEWRTVEGKKRACHFTMRSGEPFAFAGLWDL